MIIEVDEYKKKVPNYDPENSESFHRESAKLADKDFIKYLKSGKYDWIIFMAGGAASGKTEFSTSYLTKDSQLVYDGTLKNFDGFQVKLKNIKRYAKNNPKVKVILIIPDDWKQAFEIFLKRERKMQPITFFDTHIRSKVTVARVLKETEIMVEIFASSLDNHEEKLNYERLSTQDREDTVRKLIMIARDLDNRAKFEGMDIDVDYGIF